MAGIFQRLGCRLQACGPQHLIPLVLASASFQYYAYHYILCNRVKSHLQHPLLSIEQTEMSKAHVQARFEADASLHLSLLQQLFSAGLVGNCLVNARPVLWPALLGLGSSVAAVYVAWVPAVHLLALSSLVRDDHTAVVKSLKSLYIEMLKIQPWHWQRLTSASIVLQTAAIYCSLPISLAVPLSVFYLVINLE